MLGYIIITTCRDMYVDNRGNCKITTEYISNDKIRLFHSKKEAFDAACEVAENEVDNLGCNCSKDRTFGIPCDNEYENMNEVKVYCYFDNDNTELVTRRIIKPVSGETDICCKEHGDTWN